MNRQVEPSDELEALRKERYWLRSALGAIIGLFHNQEHEAKNIARRVLDSTAENRPTEPGDERALVADDVRVCGVGITVHTPEGVKRVPPQDVIFKNPPANRPTVPQGKRECQCAVYCMQAAGMRSDPPLKCRGLTGEDPHAHVRFPLNRRAES